MFTVQNPNQSFKFSNSNFKSEKLIHNQLKYILVPMDDNLTYKLIQTIPWPQCATQVAHLIIARVVLLRWQLGVRKYCAYYSYTHLRHCTDLEE